MPHLQQQGLPPSCWPPWPPQHATYNPFTETQYPAMGPMLPQSQFLPPLLALGDQTAWFQGPVTAMSRTIQDDEENVTVAVIDAKKAEMSAEDEEALIKVLKKWKASKLKMSEVFEELSKKNGRTEAEWKTWFIANFEKLNSKLDLTLNVKRAPEAGTQTSGSSGQHASTSRTPNMVTGSERSSRSRSTTGLVNARMYLSSAKLRPVVEQSSSKNRGSKFTSHHRSAANDAIRRPSHGPKNGDFLTIQRRTRVRSRAGELAAPVTSEDLRAMARHMFENGDAGHDLRRYNSLRWREFAERPENRKRTLDAWACIPRLHPRHAAAIERYLREYQEEAEPAKFATVEAVSRATELSGAETA